MKVVKLEDESRSVGRWKSLSWKMKVVQLGD